MLEWKNSFIKEDIKCNVIFYAVLSSHLFYALYVLSLDFQKRPLSSIIREVCDGWVLLHPEYLKFACQRWEFVECVYEASLAIRTGSVAVIVINRNLSAASECTQEKTRGVVIPHFTGSFVSHCRGDGDDKFHVAPPPHSRTYPLPPPFFFFFLHLKRIILCTLLCNTHWIFLLRSLSVFCHLCKRRWELFWLWATLYPLDWNKIPQ